MYIKSLSNILDSLLRLLRNWNPTEERACTVCKNSNRSGSDDYWCTDSSGTTSGQHTSHHHCPEHLLYILYLHMVLHLKAEVGSVQIIWWLTFSWYDYYKFSWWFSVFSIHLLSSHSSTRLIVGRTFVVFFIFLYEFKYACNVLLVHCEKEKKNHFRCYFAMICWNNELWYCRIMMLFFWTFLKWDQLVCGQCWETVKNSGWRDIFQGYQLYIAYPRLETYANSCYDWCTLRQVCQLYMG